MVIKFHQSKVLNNWSKFNTNLTYSGLMRDHESMFTLWRTIECLKPKSILEIGFYKGQTLGLLFESAGNDVKIVSVEKNYQYLDNFMELFPNCNINFINSDSSKLKLDQKFDFILIDGDHTYDGIKKDIEKCLPLLHKKSILCVDDYKFFEDVFQAVQEELCGQNNFVPMLCTEQQMFFHHSSHSADNFLDNELIKNATDFCEFSNIDFFGFTVCKVSILNRAIATDPYIFQSILKFYNI